MVNGTATCSASFQQLMSGCILSSANMTQAHQFAKNIHTGVCETALYYVFANCMTDGPTSALYQVAHPGDYNCYKNISTFSNCVPGATAGNTKTPALCRDLSYAVFLLNEAISLATDKVARTILFLTTQYLRYLETKNCLESCNSNHTFTLMGPRELPNEMARYATTPLIYPMMNTMGAVAAYACGLQPACLTFTAGSYYIAKPLVRRHVLVTTAFPQQLRRNMDFLVAQRACEEVYQKNQTNQTTGSESKPTGEKSDAETPSESKETKSAFAQAQEWAKDVQTHLQDQEPYIQSLVCKSGSFIVSTSRSFKKGLDYAIPALSGLSALVHSRALDSFESIPHPSSYLDQIKSTGRAYTMYTRQVIEEGLEYSTPHLQTFAEGVSEWSVEVLHTFRRLFTYFHKNLQTPPPPEKAPPPAPLPSPPPPEVEYRELKIEPISRQEIREINEFVAENLDVQFAEEVHQAAAEMSEAFMEVFQGAGSS